eukprot:sb/3479032/
MPLWGTTYSTVLKFALSYVVPLISVLTSTDSTFGANFSTHCLRGTTYTHCTEVSTDSVWCDVTGVCTGAVCTPPRWRFISRWLTVYFQLLCYIQSV